MQTLRTRRLCENEEPLGMSFSKVNLMEDSCGMFSRLLAS